MLQIAEQMREAGGGVRGKTRKCRSGKEPGEERTTRSTTEKEDGGGGGGGAEARDFTAGFGSTVGKLITNQVTLQRYILYCCQKLAEKDGGLRDKPPMRPDFYHTCYCLSGLSVAQHSRDAKEQRGGEQQGTGSGIMGSPENILVSDLHFDSHFVLSFSSSFFFLPLSPLFSSPCLLMPIMDCLPWNFVSVVSVYTDILTMLLIISP